MGQHEPGRIVSLFWAGTSIRLLVVMEADVHEIVVGAEEAAKVQEV